MKSTFNNWYEQKMRANPEISAETDRAEQLLEEIDTIAIVGLSRNRHKDSHYVGRYLQKAGYTVIPVNPGADEILGETSYSELSLIPDPVDVVDIFIRPDLIAQIVDEAIELDPKAIWLQLGTGTHNKVAEKVRDHNIRFFQNRCMKVDHQFLIRPKQQSTS